MASLDWKLQSGATPLHAAINGHNIKVVEALLEVIDRMDTDTKFECLTAIDKVRKQTQKLRGTHGNSCCVSQNYLDRQDKLGEFHYGAFPFFF